MMSLHNFHKTVQSPVIPYAGTLIDGLSPGDLVVISGFVPEGSERFQVDFQCGNSTKPRADVAFHFNPRFKRSGCIVCNTLQRERWGTEEITYEMPFEKTKPFEIVFMVRHDKFQVSVNGKHLLLYKHRINLEKIDTLAISGKVKVTVIGFVSNKEDVPDSSQFVIPYTTQLNYSVEPGRTIVIKGEVKEKANGFAINLKPSESNDIALHLNPRIKDNVFVRNSYLFNSWGEEERSIAYFPFSPGMYFELIIICKNHEYNVAINGMHILEYKHRFKQLDKIRILEVFGDVQLLDVRCW
ncbi:galectin-8 isoform X1 [Python bivittatus]|uniref:Galectin n=1 Tax=Python bivittatus TaxID=176946 RepID=A0A9F5J006_PYTBI|nr:galectin-8 isoform X1 [Python bivittatus]XP_015744724.1 galectin-8 isoform X1 [Python bivittatus]XP_025026842.1 galectin-8 isoform X1 [Python bivittatus]XP_025026843.1 galectin-8 isoform X1 [Python bivittatus]XP_025026844.1 galectin-8 isoform X1 [Python bivittatus]XP_025026845.1 galectin-8 isoform X1 [Python bivittatus]XP_025026846.1 galectin-8 isoform X1 [Python bivittatus]XP_025026847.1 galectin-8 isoform X1 [Python bivittatus]